MNPLHLYVRREYAWGKHLDIILYSRDSTTGDAKAAQPIVMETIDTTLAPSPAGRISFDDAQQWMDELWNAGLRPSSGVSSTGQIEAVKYHLEDMRKLVFKNA